MGLPGPIAADLVVIQPGLTLGLLKRFLHVPFVPFFKKPVSSATTTAAGSPRCSTTYARTSSRTPSMSRSALRSNRRVPSGPHLTSTFGLRPAVLTLQTRQQARHSRARPRGSDRVNRPPIRDINESNFLARVALVANSTLSRAVSSTPRNPRDHIIQPRYPRCLGHIPVPFLGDSLCGRGDFGHAQRLVDVDLESALGTAWPIGVRRAAKRRRHRDMKRPPTC